MANAALHAARSPDDLLREAMGSPMAISSLPLRLATFAQRDALTAILDREFGRGTAAEWVKLLSGRVPVGPVNDMKKALANPFVAATGMVQAIDHPEKRGLRVFTLPVKIDGERPQAVVAEPLGK